MKINLLTQTFVYSFQLDHMVRFSVCCVLMVKWQIFHANTLD